MLPMQMHSQDALPTAVSSQLELPQLKCVQAHRSKEEAPVCQLRFIENASGVVRTPLLRV